MKKLKKLICSISALAVCCSVSPLSANAATTSYLKGDVNNDGVVDILDSTCMLQYLRGIVGADKATSERLDLNRDYVIDVKDKEELLKIINHTVSTSKVKSVNTTMTTVQHSKVYSKYDAQTGKKICDYTLDTVDDISGSSALSRGIIGDDDRVVDYSKSGVVLLNCKNMSGDTSYVSTGFVVGAHTIVTAAHCLSGTKDLTCTFFNGAKNNTTVYKAKTYHIVKGYVQDDDIDDDYAIITVEENLNSYACFNLGVCRDGIKDVSPAKTLFVTGYSGEGSPALLGEIVTGKGNLAKNPKGIIIKPDTIHYNVDMVGGTSGAPVYLKNSDGSMTVIAINGGSDYGCNYGRRIDTDVLHFIYNNPNL